MLGVGLSLTELAARSTGVGAWSPARLFAAGETGGWWDVNPAYMYQGRTGTTAAAVGQPVGQLLDRSGNGNHAVAPTDAARPVLRQSGGLYYLEADSVDDCLVTPSIATATAETYAAAFTRTTGTTTQHLFGPGPVPGAPGTSPFRLSSNAFQPTYNGVAGPLVPAVGYTLTVPVVGVIDVDVSRADNQQVELRANGGTPGYRGSVGDASTASFERTMMGYTTGATGPFNLYGFLYVKRLLTNDERTELTAWLAAKAGVTL